MKYFPRVSYHALQMTSTLKAPRSQLRLFLATEKSTSFMESEAEQN